MLQNSSFTMRISREEKSMLIDIAKHFQRTQSDTLKTLVRELYQTLQVEKAAAPTQPTEKEPAV